MLIIPANSASASGGFNVANSCRFNDGDSASMSRDQSANNAGTNTKGNLSVWLKMSAAGTEQVIYTRETNTSNYFKVWFENDKLLIQTVTSGSVAMKKETNRVFRDPSAWYNIVVILDSTDGTAGDRQQIWINGVRETSFASSTNIGSSSSFQINTGTGTDYIARRGSGNYYDGYMAELVWIDGTDYAATLFGEFDEDSGIWKPIDVSGLTFGTNGFYLDFEDSSALGNDAAGSNNFTVNNLTAIDQSTDTCTNNFATWNRLIPPTFSNHNLIDGNLTVEGETSSQNTAFSTFAVSSGKWFCEMKLTVEGNSSSSVPNFGIASITDFRHADSEAYYESSGTNIYAGAVNNSQINRNGSNSGTSLSTTPDVGDIMGLALDLDSGTKTLKFYLNGSLVGTVNINADEYCFITAVKEDNNKATVQGNFGGTNTYTVSSGNADGDGFGNFEYAVPSGYFALCTKNLAEYG